MNKQPYLVGDLSRRVATIEGQLKGIERLLQKEDISEVLTQASAVRNALESLVKVLLQTAIIRRFEMVSLNERPEDVFERALERSMTYWFSANAQNTDTTVVRPDGEDFWTAARHRTRTIQDQLRDTTFVLEGQDYLQALRDLGTVHREIDKLVRLVLCRFVRDRMAGKTGSRKERETFERTAEDALKYWHLPDPQAASPLPSESDKKVLVVDDDPDIVDYLRHILEKHAYNVVAAADAEEAMHKVETEKPDLIILDIMMPKGTEGFHFTWRLRARSEPEYRNIPIIVLTAIHDTTNLKFYPDARDGVYGPGEFLPVEGFLDKPVGEEDLLQEVERVLRVVGQNADRSG